MSILVDKPLLITTLDMRLNLLNNQGSANYGLPCYTIIMGHCNGLFIESARPDVDTLIRLAQTSWKLRLNPEEKENLDTNLCYLFRVISSSEEERLSLKETLSLDDLLSLLMLGWPQTLSYVTFYLQQHTDEAMNIEIKQNLKTAIKQDRVHLVEFLLATQMISTDQIIEELFSDQVYLGENGVVIYLLIALNQWLKEKAPFNDKAREGYEIYLDKIIEAIKATLIPLALVTDEELMRVWFHIYVLSSPQIYPYLTDVMDQEKEVRFHQELFAITAERVGRMQQLKRRLRENRLRIDPIPDEGDTFSEEKDALQEQLKHYYNANAVLQAAPVSIRLNVAGLWVNCELGVGLQLAEIAQDILMYQQIFKQLFTLEKCSNIAPLLINVYESGATLLKRDKQAHMEGLKLGLEAKDEIALIQNAIEIVEIMQEAYKVLDQAPITADLQR